MVLAVGEGIQSNYFAVVGSRLVVDSRLAVEGSLAEGGNRLAAAGDILRIRPAVVAVAAGRSSCRP